MISKLPLCLFFVLSIISSCSPSYTKFITSYKNNDTSSIPNYSNNSHWAALPNKYDPSDSIPSPLRKYFDRDTTIDVFFLYPTSLTDPNDLRWNADINDATINAKTDYSSILYQASVFNEYNVYAPRYRQAHYRSYFANDTPAALKAFDLAYTDIRNAFKYYLEHYNNGRPIIIASHSQGTTHALRLLKEFVDSSSLKDKLVAAYLIGMYLPGNFFAELKVCEDPGQINCLCGWRTYQTNYIPPFVLKETSQSIVTNPLTWTTTNERAGIGRNDGAILRKFNRVYRNVSDAQINGGILWTHKPKFPGSFLLKTKNYHIGDINLYYFSIRNNLRQRVMMYKKTKSKP